MTPSNPGAKLKQEASSAASAVRQSAVFVGMPSPMHEAMWLKPSVHWLGEFFLKSSRAKALMEGREPAALRVAGGRMRTKAAAAHEIPILDLPKKTAMQLIFVKWVCFCRRTPAGGEDVKGYRKMGLGK